jgi:hypothetical protein
MQHWFTAGVKCQAPASDNRHGSGIGIGQGTVHEEKYAAFAPPRAIRPLKTETFTAMPEEQRGSMKKAKIHTSGKLLCCLVSMLIFAGGCTYQRKHSFGRVGMPEEVYISTALGNYYTPDVAVFSFRSDGYEGQVGQTASRLLCSEMLKRGVNANIIFKDAADAATSEELAAFAWENRYDYIVTGDILYIMNGGGTTRSRVEQEMKVYSVSGRELQVVGYAKAVETGDPLAEMNLVLVAGRRASAPSAERLMERNAGKFARLLAGMFSRNGTTP